MQAELLFRGGLQGTSTLNSTEQQSQPLNTCASCHCSGWMAYLGLRQELGLLYVKQSNVCPAFNGFILTCYKTGILIGVFRPESTIFSQHPTIFKLLGLQTVVMGWLCLLSCELQVKTGKMVSGCLFLGCRERPRLFIGVRTHLTVSDDGFVYQNQGVLLTPGMQKPKITINALNCVGQLPRLVNILELRNPAKGDLPA